MANLTVLNLLGQTDNNTATFTHEWDAGVAVPDVQPPGASVVVGDMWFDEATPGTGSGTLYTAVTDGTWTDATEEILPMTQPGAPDPHDKWFDPTPNQLYEYNNYVLLDPTIVTTGFVFAYWSLDSAGKTPIAELDIEEDTTVYAQWFRIGDFVLIRAFAATGDAYAVNKTNITTIMPVHLAKDGAAGKKWYLQYHTVPGGRILERTAYETKALATAARLQVLADLV